MLPAGIHLLLGPEDGRKREHIARLLTAVEKRCGEKPERSSLYAGEHSISAAVSQLRTGSLFHAHQIVFYYGAESVKSTEDLQLLARYCASPSTDGTLVLISQEIKVSKKIESCVPKSNIHVFWELFENQKEQFVQKYIRDRGSSIEHDAVQLLLDTVENTTDQLKVACDCLLALFSDGNAISEEHIETYLFHSKQESVFTLFHAVGKRDLEHSLDILHTLLILQEVKPFQIVSGVAWQLRRLLSVKERLQRGANPAEIWTELGIRGKRNQEQLLQAARGYSLLELQDRIRKTTEVDAALRSDRSMIHQQLMFMFIYQLVVSL